MLRALCDSYYNRHVSFDDYRTQRNQILGVIEHDLNGTEPEGYEPFPEEEITQPNHLFKTQVFQANELKGLLDEDPDEDLH